MVWIYGGGFTGGSGGQAWYDGEDLAAKGAVIVTMNYRLGAFGFFAHPELAKEAGHTGSGNYGMMDAIAALQWIKRNIARVRRRSEQRHHRRRVGRRDHGRRARRVAAGQGTLQSRDPPERRLDGAADGADDNRGTGAGRRRQGDGRRPASSRLPSCARSRSPNCRTCRAAGLVIDGYMIPGGSVDHVRQRQAERRRPARRLEQGREHVLRRRWARRSRRWRGRAPPAPGAAMEAYVARAKQQYGELADTFLKLYPVSQRCGRAADAGAGAERRDQLEHAPVRRAPVEEGEEGLRLLLHPRAAAERPAAGRTARRTRRRSPTCSTTPYANGPLEWNDVDKKLADQMSSYWVNFMTKGDPNGSGLPAWPQYKDLSKDRVIVLGDTRAGRDGGAGGEAGVLQRALRAADEGAN